MIFGAVLALASFWLVLSLVFWIGMNVLLLLVLCVEDINSAIEALADAIYTDSHPLLDRVKDRGSAAVLSSILMSSLVWIAAVVTRFSQL